MIVSLLMSDNRKLVPGTKVKVRFPFDAEDYATVVSLHGELIRIQVKIDKLKSRVFSIHRRDIIEVLPD